jgi:aspartyl-tRNA(Asn)/glutamyl-tRNA(Gln) amidotransferase subunit A
MLSRRSFIFGAVAPAWASDSKPDDLFGLTIAQTADLLRRGNLAPVDLTKACLTRIERLNPSLNAFITVAAEQALSTAKALQDQPQSRRSQGALWGIPIALKDLIDSKGVRTTAGSALWSNRVPKQDAKVAQRLAAAGAIFLGKTNMDEFAYNFTSETSHSGPIHNPWDPRRSPGGSSGGSAVAVAAGMCLAAIGSDTGGSIRLPAAFCGITGLKPTYGKVSTSGVAPLAPSLDHIGPMCRTARDAAMLLDVLSDNPNPEPTRRLGTLRLGIPRKTYYEQIHADVEKAVQGAVKVLVSLTAGSRDVVLPSLPPFEAWPDLPRAYSAIISAEAYAFHRDMLARSPDKYHPATKRNLLGGAAVSEADYRAARREMDRLRSRAGTLFSSAEVLVTPAAPATAFELGTSPGLVFLRNLAPWNLYGLPSIVIPCGFSGGLPIGLQLTGPAGSDKLLLALASAYQEKTEWHTRRPRL